MTTLWNNPLYREAWALPLRAIKLLRVSIQLLGVVSHSCDAKKFAPSPLALCC